MSESKNRLDEKATSSQTVNTTGGRRAAITGFLENAPVSIIQVITGNDHKLCIHKLRMTLTQSKNG